MRARCGLDAGYRVRPVGQCWAVGPGSLAVLVDWQAGSIGGISNHSLQVSCRHLNGGSNQH